MIDNKKLWESVLAEVELEISKANFATWFKNTNIINQDEGVARLSVPNPFVREWLSSKYHRMILKALRNFGEHIRGVEYVVVRPDLKPKEPDFEPQISAVNELPLNELYISKDDNLNPRYVFDTFVVGPFN